MVVLNAHTRRALLEIDGAVREMQEITEKKVLQRMDGQDARVAKCRLQIDTLRTHRGQQTREANEKIAFLLKTNAELNQKVKKLQEKVNHDKHERNEEKEWIVAIWPDHVVLPTLLKSFADQVESTKVDAKLQLVNELASDAPERKRFELFMNKRAARDRVVFRMEQAAQWIAANATTTEADGTVTQRVYYQNSVTGQSSWEAPAVMFYQPPVDLWDTEKMDWKPSVPLEYFAGSNPSTTTIEATSDEPTDQSSKPKEEFEDDRSEDSDMNLDLEDNDEADDIGDGDGDGDDDNKPIETTRIDPVLCRELFEQANDKLKKLEQEVEDTKTLQRSLTLQFLNATKESFEAEKQALLEEDEQKKQIEREKRREAQRQAEAAKATAAAKANAAATVATTGSSRKTSSSPVHRSSSVVSTKGLVLTKEEEVFEKELDEFVKAARADRKYLACPFAKDVRAREHLLQDAEAVHLHFVDEQVAALERLEFDLLDKTALHQEEAERKIASLESLLEEMVQTQVISEQELKSLQAQQHTRTTNEPDDEQMKRADRIRFLTESLRQLQVDMVLYQNDVAFLRQIVQFEKQVHETVWQIQADSQVERVRFMIERVSREEHVLRLHDLTLKLQNDFDVAKGLATRATNPIEQVEFRKQSQREVQRIADEMAHCRDNLQKEIEAQQKLFALEKRLIEYETQKLQQEMQLFEDKQSLWTECFALQEELLQSRKTLERLLLMTPRDMDPFDVKEKEDEEEDEDEANAKSADQLFEMNAEIFDLKLQALHKVRAFLLLCYDREQKWRQLASLTLIEATSSGDWMTLWQHQRHVEMVQDLTKRHELELLEVRKQKRLQEKVSEFLRDQLLHKQQIHDQTLAKVQSNADRVQSHSNALIAQLNQQITKLEQKQQDIEAAHRHKLDALVLRQDELRKQLEEQLHHQVHQQHDLIYFNTCLKRELRRESQVTRHLLCNLGSLHKYHAMEINDLRFRVAAQIRKIQQLTLWNASLKMQLAKMTQKMIMVHKQMDEQLQNHKQQQRYLRIANWKQRVGMQMVLSDFDLLFEFFADGLENLSGRTAQQNTKLRHNGGIEVIAALMEHSQNISIKQIACAALGKITWNENTTDRMIGWLAKTKYSQWVTRMGDQATQILETKNKQFDAKDGVFALTPEEQEEWNLFADCTDPAEFDLDTKRRPGDHQDAPEYRQLAQKRMQLLIKWNSRKQTTAPNMNLENQEYIGLASHVLKSLVKFCQSARGTLQQLHGKSPTPKDDASEQQWLVVQRNALVSLALVAMHTRNTVVVGRMEGCISILVQLLRCCVGRESFAHPFASSDQLRDEISLYVVEALGNLSFQNEFNQQQIVRNGAIGLLLQLTRQHQQQSSTAGLASNVDLLHASVKALACCCTANMEVCSEMNKHAALQTLVQLCHSHRIFDLVELEKFESIQAFASHCVLNMIGLLLPDRDSNILAFLLDPDVECLEPSKANEVHGHVPDDTRKSQQSSNSEHQETIAEKIGCFVLMCASSNREVARNGAMILGSLAFEDQVRDEVGNAGGIDALFLLANSFDEEVQALSTWALANLTWHRLNQYRVMRYFDQLYNLCAFEASCSNTSFLHASESNQTGDDSDAGSSLARLSQLQRRNETRQHALCVVANVLFFNEENRMLVGGNDKWMTLFQQICNLAQATSTTSTWKPTTRQQEQQQEEWQQRKLELVGPPALEHFAAKWLEHVARSLCSISYSDHFALCDNAHNTMQLLLRLCAHEANLVVQRHGVFGLINMCLHNINKTRMLELNGVEVLVKLSGADDLELRHAAIEALELLADVRQMKQDGASQALHETGGDLKKLLTLCDSSNSTVVAMATDAIADQVWQKPANKIKLRNEHGIDRLLRLCQENDNHPNVIVSSLWAIRNAVQENVRNQDLMHALDGINVLLRVYDRHKHNNEVVEALLAAFIAIVANHHHNSQQMIKVGLDVLIAIADGKVKASQLPQLYSRMEDHQPEQQPANLQQQGRFGGRRIENSALAADVLHLLAPFNALKPKGSSSPSPTNKKIAAAAKKALDLAPLQSQQVTK